MTANFRSILTVALLLGITQMSTAQQTPSNGNPEPAPTVKRAIQWKRFDYTCENGSKLTVYLSNNTVKVRFQDQNYLMRQTPSADGARYSDGKVVWWNRGNGGFLQNDVPDGDGSMIAKDCKLDEASNSTAKAAHTVTGTVTYMVRMALSPSAIIDVSLEDVSKADAAATVIAERQIPLGDKQVPVPFELSFDPGRIDPSHQYSVRARILVDGDLRFASDTAYPVLTRGNPDHAAIVVKPVSAQPKP